MLWCSTSAIRDTQGCLNLTRTNAVQQKCDVARLLAQSDVGGIEGGKAWPKKLVAVTCRVGILSGPYVLLGRRHAIIVALPIFFTPHCPHPATSINSHSISLGDIHYVPTQSKFAIFHDFLTVWSNAPKNRSVRGGGGMCMLFEICEKRPFQKCMGWGGGHSFEHRGTMHRTGHCSRDHSLF